MDSILSKLAGQLLVTKLKWSLRSDSHRRMAVYKTAPVAAEAQRRVKRGAGNGERGITEECLFCSAFRVLRSVFELALSRGLAPRTSAFAKRRAELITP